MSIVLPNLTDKEFSSYNDVNQMRRIIDQMNHRQERVYGYMATLIF
jgi:hypothetical protein